jgi:photosystem II stability/assembly factor-like uncharacterized protein
MFKFFTTLFALLVFANISYSQNSWTVVSTLPSPQPNINSISVVSQNIIWVACDGGRVYRSTNAGVNWVLRNTGLGTVNLSGISATDSTNCWVGNNSGTIFRTSDGGLTWTSQFTISGGFVNGIKMFSTTHGFCYGDPTGTGQPYQFRYTTNGGTNWLLSTTAPVAANEFGVINAWDWTDSSNIWVGSANLTASATTAKIYRTATGYSAGPWLSATATGTGGTAGLYFQAIGFSSVLNGMAGSNGNNFVRTSDGGLTWTTAPNPPGVATFAAINMIGIKDGSGTIRVVLQDGNSVYQVFRTTNLGANWTNEPLPAAGSSNGMQHMQFLNANLGYGGGNLGTFLRYGPATGILGNGNTTPENYVLAQNYPNPFNPVTQIEYAIPVNSLVTVKVYDVMGREVSTLVNETKPAGNYQVQFDASNLNSGVYFYTLTTEGFSETKKMLLIK